ncbi:MAG: ferritin family protein [Bacteroidota bacterium]
MKKFTSSDDILDFAIKAEQDAIDFYSRLYKTADTTNMKAAYKEFILEEKSHKDKLNKLKAEGKLAGIEIGKITDLKIADYLPEKTPHDNMDYQESLIVVMQREKAAYKLYSDLAEIADNEDLKNLFLVLAAEEAKHKLKFEIEYDDTVFMEN